jgi:hypothetical protein
MIISFIPDAFQSSSNRYRVKGAIATRCSSWVGPTARGWNRRDIVIDFLSVMRDDADADAVVGVVICGFLQYLSICYMYIYSRHPQIPLVVRDLYSKDDYPMDR